MSQDIEHLEQQISQAHREHETNTTRMKQLHEEEMSRTNEEKKSQLSNSQQEHDLAMADLMKDLDALQVNNFYRTKIRWLKIFGGQNFRAASQIFGSFVRHEILVRINEILVHLSSMRESGHFFQIKNIFTS